MTLRELIFTSDGMDDYKVCGAFYGHPTIGEIKESPEIYDRLLDKKVIWWYTSEMIPKTGIMVLNVYLEGR